MSGTMTETQTMQPRRSSKRLEGVQSTDELQQLIREARSSFGVAAAAASQPKKKQKQSSSSSLYYNSYPPFSMDQAMEILKNYDTTNNVIPIQVLRAVERTLVGNIDNNNNNMSTAQQKLRQLDTYLHKTQLAFTPLAPQAGEETTELTKFRLRMERLKLRQEERRYTGLVQNVGTAAAPDDVTTRSMTYAASIGLNMIVAPLSFGCFMYFFAGGLLNYMGWDENEQRPAHVGPDIRKVIAGVVSGVFMLIVEMILFVIRSHEMDKATRKKAKTSQPGAFGYYTSNTQRHFKDE